MSIKQIFTIKVLNIHRLNYNKLLNTPSARENTQTDTHTSIGRRTDIHS